MCHGMSHFNIKYDIKGNPGNETDTKQTQFKIYVGMTTSYTIRIDPEPHNSITRNHQFLLCGNSQIKAGIGLCASFKTVYQF